MVLKRKVTSLEAVPAHQRELYTRQADGTFALDLEGDDPAPAPAPGGDPEADKRLTEFRNNNIALQKELAELKKQFASIDMDAYQAGQKALGQLQSEEDKKLMAAGRFDDVVARQTQALREKYENDLKKIRGELDTERQSTTKTREQLKRARIASELNEVAGALKMRLVSTGVQDVYNRAYSALDLDQDGNIIGLDRDGNVRMNEERKTYSSRDFLKELLETAPHLVEGAEIPNVRGNVRRGHGGAMTMDIDANDPKAFGDNLESIAKGKIDVRIR